MLQELNSSEKEKGPLDYMDKFTSQTYTDLLRDTREGLGLPLPHSELHYDFRDLGGKLPCTAPRPALSIRPTATETLFANLFFLLRGLLVCARTHNKILIPFSQNVNI